MYVGFNNRELDDGPGPGAYEHSVEFKDNNYVPQYQCFGSSQARSLLNHP